MQSNTSPLHGALQSGRTNVISPVHKFDSNQVRVAIIGAWGSLGPTHSATLRREVSAAGRRGVRDQDTPFNTALQMAMSDKTNYSDTFH